MRLSAVDATAGNSQNVARTVSRRTRARSRCQRSALSPAACQSGSIPSSSCSSIIQARCSCRSGRSVPMSSARCATVLRSSGKIFHPPTIRAPFCRRWRPNAEAALAESDPDDATNEPAGRYRSRWRDSARYALHRPELTASLDRGEQKILAGPCAARHASIAPMRSSSRATASIRSSIGWYRAGSCRYPHAAGRPRAVHPDSSCQATCLRSRACSSTGIRMMSAPCRAA